MENQIDFPKENQMERYGTWYGAPVYKVERDEYIMCKLYDTDNTAYWITDEGYLVFKNKIKGKIRQTIDRVQVDDSVREVGKVYYKQPIEVKNVKLFDMKTNEVLMETSAEDILASVYTNKLWDEI